MFYGAAEGYLNNTIDIFTLLLKKKNSLFTVFTLSIGTPQLPTTLVL